LNERQLIHRVVDGDPAAEKELYKLHVDRVYRLAYRMTGDQTMAEDMTQDIFIRAFDRLESFRFDAKFSTWLHTLATSVILNGLRKVKRIRSREVSDESLETLHATAQAPDHDLKSRLAAAIDQLPDEQRLAVVMYDMEGYSHQEIAETTGTPVGTARARLSRARVALREILSRPRLEMEME
jgi:RNA polymerase sigma-70 factor, ECF subfamily